jgi:hypothetical protein
MAQHRLVFWTRTSAYFGWQKTAYLPSFLDEDGDVDYDVDYDVVVAPALVPDGPNWIQLAWTQEQWKKEVCMLSQTTVVLYLVR